MKKGEIISHFELSKTQIEQTDFFISKLIKHNKHTNLIGSSTIENFWDRHILDCLQLSKYINKKESYVLDLGTGAGLPGVLLSIFGYKNVLMIDSVKKKTDFVKKIIQELCLTAKIQNNRIEKALVQPQDIIVSRALAPLKKLLTYARLHSNKKTTSFFLKGRNVNNEIVIAKKSFLFDFKIFKSISDGGGCVLEIKNIKMIND